jgi:hypothetical protein
LVGVRISYLVEIVDWVGALIDLFAYFAIKKIIMRCIPLFILLFFIACNPSDVDIKEEVTVIKSPENTVDNPDKIIPNSKKEIDIKKPESIKPTKPKPAPIEISSSTNSRYAWKGNYDINTALINRFALPEGYKRVKYANFEYADWLRHLPLKAKGSKVKYYNGGTKNNEVHEAVLDVDVGTRDLQQCADAVMRLQAEYHYSKKDYSNIHFNYTSGDKVSFDDWRYGKKPKVAGNKVAFTAKSSTANNSYSNFKKYMNSIFNYAGTASLEKELKTINLTDISPGDVFIQGGFPGHAVIVVDVAENAEKKKIFMLAQSYMPAQDIHILKNLKQDSLSPWYSTDFGNTLVTPEWTFDVKNLRRFSLN